jgi:hypothetical protein
VVEHAVEQVDTEAAYFAPCFHLFVVHLHSHDDIHAEFAPFLGTWDAILDEALSSTESFLAYKE